MGALRFNDKTGDFFLVSNDETMPKKVGLTLSRTARGPGGEKIWFTKEPYAALAFYKEADPSAKARLGKLYDDYAASWATDCDQDFPLPKGEAYMPFQRAGIAYALRKGDVLFGDPPGLGKTIEAIGFANALGSERNLAVVPGTIRKEWERKIRRFSTIPNVSTDVIDKSSRGVNPYANWIIVSYELARNENLHQALCAGKWDLMVGDELHFAKTPDSLRTRALFGGGRGRFGKTWIADKCERIAGLTGTPLPNRPRECHTIAKAINWEAIDFMSYDEFCYRFNPSAQMESGYVKEDRGRLPELQARLRCNFMVRRNKEDVLKDLPDKRYELTYIDLNGSIREVLAHERIIKFSIEDLKNPFSEIFGQISTVRREMGEAIAPGVLEHVRMLLEIVELPKIVLFSHHKSVMDFFRENLKDYGVVEVRGGMSVTQKQASVDAFVGDPSKRVFSGQMEAAGFGVDGLQEVAHHIIVAEPAWTTATNEQVVDRLHRHGQHQNVVAQFMVVEGSIGERILGTWIDKSHTTHAALDAELGT